MATPSQSREKSRGLLDLDPLRVAMVIGLSLLIGCSTKVFHPSKGFVGIVNTATLSADADNLRKTYGNDVTSIIKDLTHRGAICSLDTFTHDTYTCKYSFCRGSYEQVIYWVYGINEAADVQKPQQLAHRDATMISINVPGHGEFCRNAKDANELKTK